MTTPLVRSRRARCLAVAAGLALAGTAAGVAGIQLADAASPTAPTVFVPLAPVRILDTRTGLGGSTLHDGGILTLPIASVGGVDAGASAVQLNVTVVNGSTTSYLTVWPSDETRPTASSLNWSDSAAHPNAVTATIGGDGAIKLYNFAGSVDVIADVAGYYLPGSGGGSQGPAGAQGPVGAQGPAGPQGAQGPQGVAGSARAWAMISPSGTVVTHSSNVNWTVTRLSAGLYCIQTTPNVLSNYGPLVATLHGPDQTPGFVNVNQEYGSSCNPYGGYSVATANSAGTPTDRYVLVAVL